MISKKIEVELVLCYYQLVYGKIFLKVRLFHFLINSYSLKQLVKGKLLILPLLLLIYLSHFILNYEYTQYGQQSLSDQLVPHLHKILFFPILLILLFLLSNYYIIHLIINHQVIKFQLEIDGIITYTLHNNLKAFLVGQYRYY